VGEVGGRNRVPSDRSRHRVVACHSGVAQATGWSTAGNWSIGKKVPANRNIGISPKRNSIVKPWSDSSRAENAITGAACAAPHSVATPTASAAHGEVNAPSSAPTATKAALTPKTRNTTNASWPNRMSSTPSGVASIAKYCRCHLIALITGYVVSPTAVCIAFAASTPGAT
jgi:hypothetical protein